MFSFCILNADAKNEAQSTQIANNVEENGFEYEEVVQVELSKTVLWINLKKWISSNFSSYKYVVDMEDKDAGILVVKWNTVDEHSYSRYWSARYEATYQIDVRDNKYRIKIYNSLAQVKPAITSSDMKNMSTTSLKQAVKELKMLVAISESLGDTAEWPLNSRFLQVMSSNSDYEPYMRSVKDEYYKFNYAILNSLKTSMKTVDDF